MSKLNLETFNNILVGAMKEGYTEADLIKAELNCIGNILFDECAKLLDELESKHYDSEIFRRIKNIKNNSEGLVLKLMELEPMEIVENG